MARHSHTMEASSCQLSSATTRRSFSLCTAEKSDLSGVISNTHCADLKRYHIRQKSDDAVIVARGGHTITLEDPQALYAAACDFEFRGRAKGRGLRGSDFFKDIGLASLLRVRQRRCWAGRPSTQVIPRCGDRASRLC